jgi:hypothetical protein
MTINRTQLSALRGRRGCLVGERGLLLAIIFQAVMDFHYGRPDVRQDAYNYFCGPCYQEDLGLLGLPWQLPEGIMLGGQGGRSTS